MDINKILNSLIADLLPAINKALPSFIVKEGVDPLHNILSGTDNLGEINLGICTASAEAGYSITDLKGLSSMAITSLVVGNVDASRLPVVSGMMSLSAKLQKNLSARLSGSVTAGCSPVISESADLTGTATASGVTGSSIVFYTANIAIPKSCLTGLALQHLVLTYKQIEVDVDGLGIFNQFLDSIVGTITAVFAAAISGLIASQVQPVLNNLLKGQLPFCVPLDSDGNVLERFPDRRPR